MGVNGLTQDSCSLVVKFSRKFLCCCYENAQSHHIKYFPDSSLLRLTFWWAIEEKKIWELVLKRKKGTPSSHCCSCFGVGPFNRGLARFFAPQRWLVKTWSRDKNHARLHETSKPEPSNFALLTFPVQTAKCSFATVEKDIEMPKRYAVVSILCRSQLNIEYFCTRSHPYSFELVFLLPQIVVCFLTQQNGHMQNGSKQIRRHDRCNR